MEFFFAISMIKGFMDDEYDFRGEEKKVRQYEEHNVGGFNPSLHEFNSTSIFDIEHKG